MPPITQEEFTAGEARMAAKRAAGHATAARYDATSGRVIVVLHTGVELSFPAAIAQGLSDASPDALSKIEISPSGLGLHWPQLDADLYIPGLLQGRFGSKRWMAALMGANSGKTSTPAKAAAARRNGRKGGRPRRVAVVTRSV